MASKEQILETLTSKHDKWHAAWQRRHVGAAESVLYHYTDAQGLHGIIQRQQLWASHAAFLNDSTELTYIRGVLGDVAHQLRDAHGVTADIREYAVDAYAKAGRFSATEARTASTIAFLENGPTTTGGIFDVYVSCFCELGDLLSQWRGYPSTGGGYALGLRPDALRSEGALLRRVIYSSETQRQLLYDLLTPVVEAIASAKPKDAKALQDWLINDHFARLYASLEECAFCFKHPGFEQEAEWRLVVLVHREDGASSADVRPPDVRPTQTGLLPYLKWPLERNAVAGVVVGPSAQPTLAADAAVRLLRNAGIDHAGEIVRHSGIPLRV